MFNKYFNTYTKKYLKLFGDILIELVKILTNHIVTLIINKTLLSKIYLHCFVLPDYCSIFDKEVIAHLYAVQLLILYLQQQIQVFNEHYHTSTTLYTITGSR